MIPNLRPARNVALLVVLALVVSCATLAPGEDPLVVRTEQFLVASLPVYDAAMTYAETHAKDFSPAALKVINTIRVGYPVAYHATDSALQVYKKDKSGDLLGQITELRRLVAQMTTLVALFGGPDLTVKEPVK